MEIRNPNDHANDPIDSSKSANWFGDEQKAPDVKQEAHKIENLTRSTMKEPSAETSKALVDELNSLRKCDPKYFDKLNDEFKADRQRDKSLPQITMVENKGFVSSWKDGDIQLNAIDRKGTSLDAESEHSNIGCFNTSWVPGSVEVSTRNGDKMQWKDPYSNEFFPGLKDKSIWKGAPADQAKTPQNAEPIWKGTPADQAKTPQNAQTFWQGMPADQAQTPANAETIWAK